MKGTKFIQPGADSQSAVCRMAGEPVFFFMSLLGGESYDVCERLLTETRDAVKTDAETRKHCSRQSSSLLNMHQILEENLNTELGGYLNVSLRGTDCLQKVKMLFSFHLTSI